jgi:hypothetical protein
MALSIAEFRQEMLPGVAEWVRPTSGTAGVMLTRGYRSLWLDTEEVVQDGNAGLLPLSAER